MAAPERHAEAAPPLTVKGKFNALFREDHLIAYDNQG